MPDPGTHVLFAVKQAWRLALIGLLFFAGASFAGPPATTLYGIMGDGISTNYTFARVETDGPNAGRATAMFSFDLGYPISALTYDPSTGKLVALGQVGSNVPYVGMVVEIDAVTQTAEEHVIAGLPASPLTNFSGIEYNPTQCNLSPTAFHHVLVTYGQAMNQNLQNRIAAVNPSTGVVRLFTAPPLGVSDFDQIVINPVTSQLIDADTNNPPFETIFNVFDTPSIGIYATPTNDGELYDPAVYPGSPDGRVAAGTMFFSRRATRDLWKLKSDGSGYKQIGPHLLSNLWAVGGLAFAP